MTVFVTATVTPARVHPTYKAVHTVRVAPLLRLFRMTVFVTATVTPARVHPTYKAVHTLCSPIQNDRVCDRDRDTCACPPYLQGCAHCPCRTSMTLYLLAALLAYSE
ncbi:hypothetical protein J6590_024644 [Homalodisca vitripennis]|nr:hypothetical protein J6590_024644 [Homalodisca vitripennis]